MTALDVEVFLQEETEGEEDDQEQRQSVGADGKAAQVFFSPDFDFQKILTSKSFLIFLFACSRQGM